MLAAANIVSKRLTDIVDERVFVNAVTGLTPRCTGCGSRLCGCDLRP